MRLYDERNQRLYVNTLERARFLAAAAEARFQVRAFCLTLLHTGCRLTEAIELCVGSVDTDSQLISFRTLKKRDRHTVREVPIPPTLSEALADLVYIRQAIGGMVHREERPLWTHKEKPLNRATGYRWIKRVMQEADIHGAQGSPKGLRHGYGVHALRSGVPLNMLRKWMGHTSMATTAIYANAIGSEEMEIAERMWGEHVG